MLSRRRLFALLSVASLVLSSYSVGRRSAPDGGPAGRTFIQILLKPPSKVCKDGQEEIAIAYTFEPTFEEPLAPLGGPGAAPTLLAAVGTGEALAVTNPMVPAAWSIAAPTGWGGRTWTYTAKNTGLERITFRVSLNGVTKEEVLLFEVIDCKYHAHIEWQNVWHGGGDFKDLILIGVWDAGGGFAVSGNGQVEGVGDGKLEGTWKGSAMECTCEPTPTVTSKTPFNFLGSRDKAGLHLGFDFGELHFTPDTPIECTVGDEKVQLTRDPAADLSGLPFAKITKYADRTQVKSFNWYGGKGKLTITKAQAKVQP